MLCGCDVCERHDFVELLIAFHIPIRLKHLGLLSTFLLNYNSQAIRFQLHKAIVTDSTQSL